MTISGNLNVLEQTGLIHPAQLEPQLEYIFKHALVQEAAYTSILRTDRRTLHSLVAQSLEQSLGAHPGLDALSLLAMHFREAGDDQRAGKYFLQASKIALANFANREAESLARSAYEIADQDHDRADAAAVLSEALERVGRNADALIVCKESIELYRRIGNIDQAARQYSLAIWRSATTQSLDETGALVDEALRFIQPLPKTAGVARVWRSAVRNYIDRDVPQEALSAARNAYEIAQQAGDSELWAESNLVMGRVYESVLFDHQAASQYLAKAIEIAETHSHWMTAVRAHHIRGTMPDQGFAESVQHFEHAVKLCEEHGLNTWELFLSLMLGSRVLLFMGELDKADEWIQHCQRYKREIGVQALDAFHSDLGSILLMAERGQFIESLALLDSIWQSYQGFDRDWARFLSAQLKARIILDHAEFRRAELWDECIGQLALAESMAMVDYDPVHEILIRIRCLAQTGRIDQARREFAAVPRKESPPEFERSEWLQAEASIALAEQDIESASAIYEHAIEFDQQIGRFPQRARSLVALAEIYRLRDQSDRSTPLLEQALAEFDRMGMKYDAEQVRRMLK